MAVGATCTSATLAGLAVLHVLWGRGSSFPFRTRDELADAVVGSPSVPPPGACFAVAAALASGAALVADVAPVPRGLRRTALLVMAGILGTRSALGFTGRTTVVSSGATSATFTRLDRRFFAPLCLALAVGTLVARCGSRSWR